MSKRNLTRSPESSSNTHGWLTTFNDLITLLMVFFVLLFTMGSMDNNLMKEFQNALQSGLGILAAGSKVSVAVNESQKPISVEEPLTQGQGATTPGREEGSEVIDEAMRAFAAEPGINVKYSNQGARIAFEDALLFDFGKAAINVNGLAALSALRGTRIMCPFIPNAFHRTGICPRPGPSAC
jgi:chemotaxis protein MotB